MGTTTKEIGSSSFNDMISSVDRRSEYVENRAGANVRLNNFLTPYTLDNKSSILNAPCGYSNGVYASLRPSDARGPELVVNGMFDSDSDWTKGTGWSIANGKASCDGTQTGTSTLETSVGISGIQNKSVLLSFEVSNYSAGAISVTLQGTGGIEFNNLAANGVYEINVTSTDSLPRLLFNANSSFVGSIDNVSVKEDTSADFDFVRGTAATRVTKNGLVKDVQILSDDLVQNGNFEEIGPELISNGDFSQIGSERVTNGSFDSDSNWTKGTGWSITDGKAVCDGTINTSISQSNVFTIGKIYKVNISVNDVVGSLDTRFWMGTGGDKININSQGDYTAYWKADGTDILFTTLSGNTATYSIDNVSVVEVGQDWQFSNGWSIEDGKAVCDGTNSPLDQYSVTTVGKTYKVQLTVSDMTTASVNVRLGMSSSDIIGSITDNGTYTFYGKVASDTTLRVRSSSGFDGSVTNISVKEVLQDWKVEDYGAVSASAVITPEDGGVKLEKTSNDDWRSSFLVQSMSYTVGSKYKVTFSLKNGNISGIPNLYLRDNYQFSSRNIANIRTLTNDWVEYTYYFEATSASDDISIGNVNWQNAGAGEYFYIDNFSIIEITDDTNLPRIDYTNGTGALLLEPQSTNTATYSNDFTQGDLFNGSSDPSLASSVLTSEQGIAPDGTNTAQRLTDNNDGGTGNMGFSYFAVNLTSGQQSTVSIFVKKDTLRYFVISFANYDTSEEISFDLDTNTINRGSGVITEYGNGWYRCSATFSTTTDTVGAIGFYGTNLANVIGGNLRDGTKSVLVWGLQCEELPYASSYIPTNGSTVTRNKDQAYRSGISNLINSQEGVLYMETKALADDNISRRISLSDGTSSNRILLYFNPSNKIQALNVTGGTTQGNMTFTTDIKKFNKIAFKYKENDFALFVNGVKVNTDTSGLTYSSGTLNRLGFDNAVNGEPLFSRTRSIAVFNEALTDEELAKITSTTQQEVFYEMRDKMQQINADYYEFGDYTTRLKKLF